MTGALVWITGLAGSGKTTIAKGVVDGLKAKGVHVVHLDGDMLRDILGNGWGHTREDRLRLSHIYARLCAALTAQGVTVVMSTIALFHEIHAHNRAHNPRYLEVLVQAKDEELTRRREIYRKDAGHVVGQHIPPEFPKEPHLTLTNDDHAHLAQNIATVLAHIPR